MNSCKSDIVPEVRIAALLLSVHSTAELLRANIYLARGPASAQQHHIQPTLHPIHLAFLFLSTAGVVPCRSLYTPKAQRSISTKPELLRDCVQRNSNSVQLCTFIKKHILFERSKYTKQIKYICAKIEIIIY